MWTATFTGRSLPYLKEERKKERKEERKEGREVGR
jgi:hypothetical protein